MKKHKKPISLITAILIFILNFCIISIPAVAVADPQYAFSGADATIAKASVLVRYSPYSFTPSNDTISAGQQIKVIERDGNYYYIEYLKSTENFTRTGYILMSDVTVTGTVPWCNYNIFTPGEIISSSNVPAYFGPHTSHYMCVTHLSNVLGDATLNGSVNDSRLLTVLKSYKHPKTNQEFYMVQYVANHNDLANTVQPYYIRCWVPKATVSLKIQSGEGYFPGESYTLIRNVNKLGYGGDGMYLTAVQDANGNWGVELQEPTGYANQQWKVVRFDYGDTDFIPSSVIPNIGGVYYKIISKAAPNKCLQLANNVPQMGTKIVLADITDYPNYQWAPNKAQEFKLDPIVTGQNKEGLTGPGFEYNGIQYIGQLYRIRSRLSGTYGGISLANGIEVVHSRVAATWVGNWSFEKPLRSWNGGYISMAKINDIIQVPYYISVGSTFESVESLGITKAQVESAVNRWNNINDPFGEQIAVKNTLNEYNALVKIFADDLGTKATAQMFHVIRIGENDAYQAFETDYLSIPWAKSQVRLNSNSSSQGFSSVRTMNAKQGVICHEFGHALKLMHPYGQLSSDDADQVVYSVMNQGIYTKEEDNTQNSKSKVKYYPTDYDKVTLNNNWSVY